MGTPRSLKGAPEWEPSGSAAVECEEQPRARSAMASRLVWRAVPLQRRHFQHAARQVINCEEPQELMLMMSERMQCTTPEARGYCDKQLREGSLKRPELEMCLGIIERDLIFLGVGTKHSCLDSQGGPPGTHASPS